MNATNLALSLVVGVLFAGGTYLLLQRSLLRVVLGFVLLGHGANLVLLIAGGRAGDPPIADETSAQAAADPLAQAMVLTAIVITFAVTALLLALAHRSVALHGDDEVQDDVEDRLIRRREEQLEDGP
ncbi:MAG TPA: Na(+)/H(+) antiporter subunit C [Nocardioidaceae bacterium]|nr:Na(+)/H(+) antiporter subunit C [Nocardioidaceae bacterium]